MFPGEKLTEYTSEELQTLLNAIARQTDYLLYNQYDPKVREQLRNIEQWKTKVIEAKAEVRLKEIQTEN